jgi:hypothetical protein
MENKPIKKQLIFNRPILRVQITAKFGTAPWCSAGQKFNVVRSLAFRDLFIVTEGIYAGLTINERDCFMA